jgi:hypothetical protein
MHPTQRIETVSNIATIVVASLLSAVLIRVYLFPMWFAHRAASEVRIGTSIKNRLPDMDWAKNGRTLVMALSTQCHFCTESAPFYRRLAGATAGNLKTVAILPQPVPEAQHYLSGEGVHVDEVRQGTVRSMGLAGTPTLLLVDGAGVVRNLWVGKLEPNQEIQVLNALQKTAGG